MRSSDSDKQSEQSDIVVDAWLQKTRELYEKEQKINDFKKEEECLRAYLVKLIEETSPSGRLSMCRLEAPFKKGGTAIVFKGSHSRIEDQGLVVKFNRPRIEEDTRKLIENEHRVLPLLEHSNIVRVIDTGRFEIRSDEHSCPPLLFIVEPLIPETINLRDYVQKLSLSEEEEVTEDLLDDSLRNLTKVLRQWVDALSYVHKKQFVYLDVKPDNCIVDKDEHLVLIDFGTAEKVDLEDPTPTDIFFSEPYAHPRIKERFERTSTNRVRAAIKRQDITSELDYYALGKSVLELLEILACIIGMIFHKGLSLGRFTFWQLAFSMDRTEPCIARPLLYWAKILGWTRYLMG